MTHSKHNKWFILHVFKCQIKLILKMFDVFIQQY
jgi:hypothetical protein